MKHKILVITACLLATSCFAASPAVPPSDNRPSQVDSPSDFHTPWSIVGEWRCTHPTWHDIITICADGTFSRAQGDTGRWTLSGLQDHLIIVLVWKDWGAETLTMLGPDDFRGNVRGADTDYGEMVLHRIQPPAPKLW